MRVEELERELRADRPQAEPEFARKLDEWAAAGFPRDRGLGPRAVYGSDRLRRVWERLTTLPPRRVLAPVGALATVIVVVAIAANPSGQDDRGERLGSSSSSEDSAGSSAESTGGSAAQAPSEAIAPAPPGGATAPDVRLDAAGGIARGTDDRLVEATVQLTLGADADEVQDVANDVVEVTDRYGGIVLDSRVSRDERGARAGFELEIPAARLDAALTDLSGLTDVISRTEAGQDITARAVRARKQLAGTREQVRRARIELIEADTRGERLVIRSQIDSLRASADAQRADLNGVKREARFATVSVEITSDARAAAAADGWSLGDALDDAGRVLEVVGGGALVALAVVVPLGLVAALTWLVVSRARRSLRERALDA